MECGDIPRLRKNIPTPTRIKNDSPTSVESGDEKCGDLEFDPALKAFLTVDWADSSVLENQLAVGAIEQVVAQCHPSVLQLMLKLIERRIRGDFRLFMNMQMELETLRKLKELGDYTYL